MIERCAAIPLPPVQPRDARAAKLAIRVGPATSAAARALRRGVGFAVGFKNVAYSEGFDDAAEATVTLSEGPTARSPASTPPPWTSARGSRRC